MNPIEVHATPTPAQIAAALRQFVTVAGTIAGTLGYADLFTDDRVNMALSMIGPISAVVALAWGQLATRASAKKSAAMAGMLPDDKAVTK